MAVLRYGQVKGEEIVVEKGITASDTYDLKGGGFVKLDTSTGYVTRCGAADTEIYGWAKPPFGNANRVSGTVYTASSTAGLDKAAVYLAHSGAIFRIPADATPAATDVGKACDIVVSSSLQQADIGTSTTDVLMIVDVTTDDIADTAVQVSVNARQATT
jgi:hypothetical protein